MPSRHALRAALIWSSAGLLICSRGTAAAIEPSLPSDPAQPQDRLEAAVGQPTVCPLRSREYGVLVLEDTRHILTAPIHWKTREWMLAGVGTGAVIGVAAVLDRPIQTAMQRHRSKATNAIARVFNPLGNEYAFIIPGGFYLAGIVGRNDTAKLVAQDAVAATLVEAGMITPMLKLAIGRSRPKDDEGTDAFAPFHGKGVFPSGHTGQAFTLASVVTEHYHAPWVTCAAYGTAGLVGFSRIVDNAHYTSDVMAGAVIGIVVGRAIVHLNTQQRFRFSPLVDGNTNGLAAVYAF